MKTSLRLVLTPATGREKIVNFGGLSWATAKKLFERNYYRFLLIKTKGSRKRAARLADMAPHWVSRQITLLSLEEEFPLHPASSRYEYDYVLSESEFVLFSGTLYQLEDRYILQTLREVGGDEKKALGILREGFRDAYPGRVLRRLSGMSEHDLSYLAVSVKHNPIVFQETLLPIQESLASLRRRYMMQVLTMCKGNIKKARRILGVDKPAVFRMMVSRYIPRHKQSRKDKSSD